MRSTKIILVTSLFGLLAWAPALAAQDNSEIQVYGADLVPPGATMFELHSKFTTHSEVDLAPGQPTPGRMNSGRSSISTRADGTGR